MSFASSSKPRFQKQSGPRKPPRPMDAARLEEMALAYVARFATSAGKLRAYLRRKLCERGWQGPGEVNPENARGGEALAEGFARAETLVERFVAVGYVEDESFAKARSGSLQRRGFGTRRIAEELGAAGIEEELRERVLPGEGAQRRAALALARKRRFGPFGAIGEEGRALDPAVRQKQIAAMLRAGHGLEAARRLVSAASTEDAERWVEEAGEDESDDGEAGGGW